MKNMGSYYESARQAALERKTKKQQARINSLSGVGKYRYRNDSNRDIGLPKPADDGRSWIPPGSCFTGDSYFHCIGGITEIEVYDDGSPKPEPAPPAPAQVQATTPAQAEVKITVQAPKLVEDVKQQAESKTDDKGPRRPKPQLKIPRAAKSEGDAEDNGENPE